MAQQFLTQRACLRRRRRGAHRPPGAHLGRADRWSEETGRGGGAMLLRVNWSDVSLFERQAATLVASWEAYATGSRGARVERGDDVSVGVFPAEPERLVYDNALLQRGTDAARRSTAIETVERVYRAAGIDRYAAWVHESDGPMIEQLTARGYCLDTSTRVMAMSLDVIPVPEPEIELGPASWEECLRIRNILQGNGGNMGNPA